MAQILVAQFDDFASAQSAAADLRALGVAQGDIEIFALNAPGQHDAIPIGGDEDEDRGARKGDEGAVAGAAIGGAAGVALGAVAIPVVGPIAAAAGAAVGAYTGRWHGAVNSMGETRRRRRRSRRVPRACAWRCMSVSCLSRAACSPPSGATTCARSRRARARGATAGRTSIR